MSHLTVPRSYLTTSFRVVMPCTPLERYCAVFTLKKTAVSNETLAAINQTVWSYFSRHGFFIFTTVNSTKIIS